MKPVHVIVLCSLCTFLCFSGLAQMENDMSTYLFDLSDPALRVIYHASVATPADVEKQPSTHIAFQEAMWPHVMLRPAEKVWDWSEWDMLVFDLYNPEEEPLTIGIRVDNEGAPDHQYCVTQFASIEPMTWKKVKVRLQMDERLWGMRGVPGVDPQTVRSGTVDITQITAFQLFLPRPERPHDLHIGNIALQQDHERRVRVEFPFIDMFGQYKHDDWPGKIHSIDEMHAKRDKEQDMLKAFEPVAHFDEMGGWIDGPQLEATGWFRTAFHDGRWWLVTPQGRLFISLGVTCVGHGDRTFVEGRKDWFAWLPEEDDPQFSRFYADYGPAHSMAEPIGGSGRTFGFYEANLVRKYGEDWDHLWRETTYKRLPHWGFNTIGTWSLDTVYANSPVPFTPIAYSSWGVRKIEAGTGYWGKMVDVFDAGFPEQVERGISHVATRYADNPLCIGFFVDNEISWDDVRAHTLASPVDQPARVFIIDMLQQRYESIDTLNAAWGTDASDWDTLDKPNDENEACRADMDDYVYAFAVRYFKTIRDALQRHAPNHLYLGCRFMMPPCEPIMRACAEYADVIGANMYQVEVDAEIWNLTSTFNTPVIIGEFHFGALDRGMFHTGLQAAENQEDRAKKYMQYVQSVLESPTIVGCHWFQYIDQPATGRCLDGENYNIGLVTITDTPYPELTEAARKIHSKAYNIRGTE